MRRADPKFDLLLTGVRQRGRHLVFARGERAWLSTALFEALCQLAAAHRDGQAEYVRLARLVVHRLRKTIDGATQPRGSGRVLIETGAGGEYRLTTPRGRIAVDASFTHLPAPGLVRAADKQALLAFCRVLPSVLEEEGPASGGGGLKQERNNKETRNR